MQNDIYSLAEAYLTLLRLCRSDSYEERLFEVEQDCLEALGMIFRYNHNHDPHTGRFTSGNGVDNNGKSDIIKPERVKNIAIHSTEKTIELPIEQKHTGKGNPNAVLTFGDELNSRQKHLLEQLSEFDSRIIISKKEVNMTDLSALTAHTGDEFAMFTKGHKRLIIRGNSSMVNLDTEQAEILAKDGYRWSGHTHPGTGYNCLVASLGDNEVLKRFKQNASAIYNSQGQHLTFQKE